MLTKRHLAMLLTMIFVVLVLFLSTVAVKEYFNDYDKNHAAEATGTPRAKAADAVEQDAKRVVYIGSRDNGYFPAVQEWANYRRLGCISFASFQKVDGEIWSEPEKTQLLLVDGTLLTANSKNAIKRLTDYVSRGGVAVFYRLPSYQTINDSWELQTLLGIQHLRGEAVELYEIDLYGGFLLGGETHYCFEGRDDETMADLDRTVPWYDISARTKTYMVGLITEEQKTAQALENEDLPAIIWRSSLESGYVFAVNGDYMKGEPALGFLDAMCYESQNYALYEVVNAQNFSATGFPDLTVENEVALQAAYGMTNQQFCRDILWPSLVAAAQKGDWKITSFLSVKQSAAAMEDPRQADLIDYLKYMNEESAEAGISLGRLDSTDLGNAAAEDRNVLEYWQMEYAFTGAYVREEQKKMVTGLLDGQGKMKEFTDIRTIVGEYDPDAPILSWISDEITLQNATTNAYRHSDRDSLRLKSLETALGYSNVQADIYRILWPESIEDEWQTVAEKMAANMDTYWKPFSAFEKTTITQSDERVRNFLNGSVNSTRNGDQIRIQVRGYSKEAFLLLRTHGEIPMAMNGGDWTEVEKDTYLLRITEETASVTLKREYQLEEVE